MLEVHAIPILKDNYVWVLQHPAQKSVYVFDPGVSEPVARFLDAQQMTLAGLIITHRHNDHTGGIGDLLRTHNVPVYGPDSSAIPQVTHTLGEGDKLTLWGAGSSIQLTVLSTPGHIPEHLSYLYSQNEESKLFCGDTLFSSGCGRIFVGSFEALKSSLDRFKALPPETQVYCSHEYTLTNLAFARGVEPNNKNIAQREHTVTQMRQDGKPSLPSSIAIELEVNPFLRCDQVEVQRAAEAYKSHRLDSELEVFAALRTWRNNF